MMSGTASTQSAKQLDPFCLDERNVSKICFAKVTRMRPAKLEAITNNIMLIHGERRGKFPNSHSILILDESSGLIDTGCGPEVLQDIKKHYDVDFIINSHTHPDHTACNWMFNEKPIYVPEEGLSTSGNVVTLSQRFVSKELAPTWQKFVRGSMNFKNCTPTNSYTSRTTFNFGETTILPIHTPGHTKDHYCFYIEKEKILFSFDYDLTEFPWYGHRESSISEFRESVMKLKALSLETVVSSHRGIINERIDAEFTKYQSIIDERNAHILSLLKAEKTLGQLVDMAPIYGAFPYAPKLLRYWEEKMIEKHLNELEIHQKIRKTPTGYTRIYN